MQAIPKGSLSCFEVFRNAYERKKVMIYCSYLAKHRGHWTALVRNNEVTMPARPAYSLAVPLSCLSKSNRYARSSAISEADVPQERLQDRTDSLPKKANDLDSLTFKKAGEIPAKRQGRRASVKRVHVF
ncbi:hypothetical protein J6590_000291 [Homalodisca vitripennis]|nr:hypothetical protein J6590_000291 [Homalodisca vitripennis]